MIEQSCKSSRWMMEKHLKQRSEPFTIAPEERLFLCPLVRVPNAPDAPDALRDSQFQEGAGNAAIKTEEKDHVRFVGTPSYCCHHCRFYPFCRYASHSRSTASLVTVPTLYKG